MGAGNINPADLNFWEWGAILLVAGIVMFLGTEVLARVMARDNNGEGLWLDEYSKWFARILTAGVLLYVLAALVFLVPWFIVALL